MARRGCHCWNRSYSVITPLYRATVGLRAKKGKGVQYVDGVPFVLKMRISTDYVTEPS